ncbi:hypothetical protein D3C86_1847920 [compost metagenome]
MCRLRKYSICACHGLRSTTLANWLGNGVSPGWRKNASRAAPGGALRAALPGSCAGAGPIAAGGNPKGAAGVVGSSFSGPNSSNSTSCWVNG